MYERLWDLDFSTAVIQIAFFVWKLLLEETKQTHKRAERQWQSNIQ